MRLFECLYNYNQAIPTFRFEGMVPVNGDICTFRGIQQGGGYQFEESRVFNPKSGNECSFTKEMWRELTEIPSSLEVQQMVEETQLVEL